MTDAGEDVVLGDEDIAISQAQPRSGDRTTVYREDLGRGKSEPKSGDPAVLVGNGIAQTAAGILPADAVFMGNGAGNMYKVNKTNGNRLWRFQTPDNQNIRTSVAIDSNHVYFGCRDKGNPTFFKVNASTGNEVWSYDTNADVRSSPAVIGGYLYFGSVNGNLYKLDKDTGALQWTYQVGSGNALNSSVAIVGNKIYFTSIGNSTDTKVHCVDTSGNEVWVNQTNNVGYSPAVVSGNVYVSKGGALLKLDASTGSEVWRENVPGSNCGSPAVVNGKVYVTSNFANYHLTKIDASTGNKDWRSQAMGNCIPDLGPTVVDGAVYLGSQGSNSIHKIDASTGNEVWSNNLGQSVATALAYRQGKLYFGSDVIYRADASTGNIEWTSPSNQPPRFVVPVGRADGWCFANRPGRFNENTNPLDTK